MWAGANCKLEGETEITAQNNLVPTALLRHIQAPGFFCCTGAEALQLAVPQLVLSKIRSVLDVATLPAPQEGATCKKRR